MKGAVLLSFLLFACRDERSAGSVSAKGAAIQSAPNQSEPTDKCVGHAGVTISGNEVGSVRMGSTVQAVRAACKVLRDSVDYNAEAIPERAIAVVVGADTILAAIDSTGRVARIEVTGTVFQTRDSLGVGTSFTRLAQIAEATASELDGRLYVTAPSQCGITFGMRYEGPERLIAHMKASALLGSVRPMRVDEVIVTGCSPKKY